MDYNRIVNKFSETKVKSITLNNFIVSDNFITLDKLNNFIIYRFTIDRPDNLTDMYNPLKYPADR